MPYGWKKMLEIEAERKKKREEKARIKAEKEKKKLEERKIARAKKSKKKSNAKYYRKKKEAIDEYRKLMGDEAGTFSIYLMKDGKRFKYFGKKRYKNSALEMYYDILKKNKEEVTFHRKYTKCARTLIEHKYELILVQRLPNEETNKVALLRNEDGKFIENIIIDSEHHKILDKNDWLIEETFNIYGFDNLRERKNYNYIFNNIILRDTSIYSRIFIYNNKLIHHYDDDFDMVICKDINQAIELYEKIEKELDHKKYPNILFMGKISGTMSLWFIDEMMKKTGWTKTRCKEIR